MLCLFHTPDQADITACSYFADDIDSVRDIVADEVLNPKKAFDQRDRVLAEEVASLAHLRQWEVVPGEPVALFDCLTEVVNVGQPHFLGDRPLTSFTRPRTTNNVRVLRRHAGHSPFLDSHLTPFLSQLVFNGERALHVLNPASRPTAR